LSDIAAHPWLQSNSRSAHHSTVNEYTSSVEALSPSCCKQGRVDDSQYSSDRYIDDNCSPKCDGPMLQWQYNGNSSSSPEYFSPCHGAYNKTSVFGHKTSLDDSNVQTTGWHVSPKCSEYRRDHHAVQGQLMTSFIGKDVIAVDSSVHMSCFGRHSCDGKCLSFSDSIRSHSPFPSFHCVPSKKFSADSLNVGDEPCGVEDTADYCSDSVSDADYNDTSGDDACLRCYDFADIDAVLDSIADVRQLQDKDGLQLSCDSLE